MQVWKGCYGETQDTLFNSYAMTQFPLCKETKVYYTSTKSKQLMIIVRKARKRYQGEEAITSPLQENIYESPVAQHPLSPRMLSA